MLNYVVSVCHVSLLAFLRTVWQTGDAGWMVDMQRVIGKSGMRLYGLKNCDSCKKALLQLRTAGHDIAFFDIRTDPLEHSQIADLLTRHGDRLVLNRKSTTWRNLAKSDRLLSPLTLLAMHPTLIKRPVIFHNDSSYVGWDTDVQIAFGVE